MTKDETEMLSRARAEEREVCAKIADEVQAEDEAEWNRLGGEDGTPDWYVEHRPPTDGEYVENCFRLAASGGADTAERIAAAIRARANTDLRCDLCCHRHSDRLGGVCVGCPCGRIILAPACPEGEGEGGA